MRPSRTGAKTLLAAVALAASLVSARPSHAEVVLAPSPEGYIGAWLLAGPLPRRSGPADVSMPLPAAGAPVGERLGWLTWSLRDGGTGPLDLNQKFGPKERRAALATVLSVPSEVEALLLVSADGYLTVGLDGQTVFTRPIPHLRGFGLDPIPLTLAPGDHTLTLLLERRGGPWNVEARLVSRADLEPPPGVRLKYPGTTDAEAQALAAKLSHVTVRAGLVPAGYQPRVVVEFPRGAPVDPSVHVQVSETLKGAALGSPIDAGALPIDGGGAEPLTVFLPAVPANHRGSVPDDIAVTVASGTTRHSPALDGVAPALAERLLAVRASVQEGKHPTLYDPEVVVASATELVRELGALADRGDGFLPSVEKRAASFVDAVEQDRDPILEPGVQILALPSPVDGEPDGMRVHVPRSYKPGEARKYPLVVVLHGYQGSPAGVMNAFLGTESLAPHPAVDGFVIAPNAHGDAFYRGPGEVTVIDAISWALRTYPIDPDRVSITGISMGGTGATHIAFRYPDLFTTVAALAGYHSHFVRRDVTGKPLRAWEWMELSRWSPVSYAENGKDLFLYATQGTQDLPLVHTTSLADRWRMLGYDLKEDYPEIGHDVWRIAWKDASLFPLLTGRRRVTDPTHIVYRTDCLRLGKRAWVNVTDLESWGVPARVDARVAAKDTVVVHTSGTDGLQVTRPVRWIKEATPLTVVVDGQKFPVGTEPTLAVSKDAGGRWVAGARERAPGEKRAGLEGPIRDAWSAPLAFVYGTLDPAQTNATRELAEHFEARYGGSAKYPVIADVALPKSMMDTHSLFLVGSPAANAVVRDLDAGLTFGITDAGVREPRGTLTGDDELGFLYVQPNPWNPSRYVVLLEAKNARGLFRALSLPMQLPDFIVYDSRVAPAAGQQVLADASVLAAGYFDRNWALPADFSDRIAISAGRDGSWWVPPSEPRTPAGAPKAPPP
ncbi:MAG TPA: alpha/beta hydrolase-fold protein [Polyangiaceae bacterium]|nr:alpha/beta hydrolase-fold protein [Polyangiaceae bacterium]